MTRNKLKIKSFFKLELFGIVNSFRAISANIGQSRFISGNFGQHRVTCHFLNFEIFRILVKDWILLQRLFPFLPLKRYNYKISKFNNILLLFDYYYFNSIINGSCNNLYRYNFPNKWIIILGKKFESSKFNEILDSRKRRIAKNVRAIRKRLLR